MAGLKAALEDTTVVLDERSKESYAQIREIIDGQGKTTLLMAIAHLFGWLDKESGPVNIALNDWKGFAKSLHGINAIHLAAIRNIAGAEAARFYLGNSGNQLQFWTNVRNAAESAMISSAKRGL